MKFFLLQLTGCTVYFLVLWLLVYYYFFVIDQRLYILKPWVYFVTVCYIFADLVLTFRPSRSTVGRTGGTLASGTCTSPAPPRTTFSRASSWPRPSNTSTSRSPRTPSFLWTSGCSTRRPIHYPYRGPTPSSRKRRNEEKLGSN